MKLLVNDPVGSAELKCFITLAETEAKYSVGKVNAKQAEFGPHLEIDAKNAPTKQIFSANAVCRYLAFAKDALQAEDLIVDDWIEWETTVLSPFVAKLKTLKSPKNSASTSAAKELAELLQQKEEARATKVDKLEFLFGNKLSLADIIVGVTLRDAFALIKASEEPMFKLFSAYVQQLFALPSFVKGLGLLESGGKPVVKSSLDAKQTQGFTYHNVLSIVEAVFAEAIHTAFPQVDLASVEVTRTSNKNTQFGDYQCNSAMNIFTSLKGKPNAPRSPRDVAQAIISAIPDNDVFERISVAGAGFINVFLNPRFLCNRIETLLNQGVQASPVPCQKIVIDFSSPNIAKDMHVGHLRSTIIGEAMSRILEFQGHTVDRVNHVGDWGTQFGMLICHLMDTYPNWEQETPDVQDLTKLYKAAKQRFDEDKDFYQRSKDQVVLLQSGDPNSRKVWETICEISRKEYQKVYDRLNVTLEEFGESFYNQYIPGVLDMLKQQEITQDSNGALVVFTTKFKQPFILVKSDGSYLYDTTDIAALWYRLHQLHADWVIYYTDYTQKDHFSLLFEVGRMAKLLDDNKHRVDHIGFGTVNDESGKRFKTRSGEVVRLVDLLDEAKSRMKNQLLERIEAGQTTLPADQVDQAAEKIGYGAVKYFDLRQSPTSNYVFGFDRMLSTNGDTAVFLLYAFARLKSIIKKSGVDMDKLKQTPQVLNPQHATELALALELLQFQDVLLFINRDLMSNRLCSYLYSLAEKVQVFATACRVIGSDEQNSRLLLCEATVQVMATCFSLLGIDPLDQI